MCLQSPEKGVIPLELESQELVCPLEVGTENLNLGPLEEQYGSM